MCFIITQKSKQLPFNLRSLSYPKMAILKKCIKQCCHSVMKKNPRIYLEKNPENDKKNPDIQNV